MYKIEHEMPVEIYQIKSSELVWGPEQDINFR